MPAEPAPDNFDRVLLLSPTARDGLTSQKLFAAAGIDCVVCDNVLTLCEWITEGAAAVIVPEETLLVDYENVLARCIAKQPVWSDFPVIVLSRTGAESPAVAKALETMGNVSVIERPTRVSTLLSLVRTTLRARKRQYDVRDYLRARTAAEATLRGEQVRLRLAMEAADLGAWESDRPSGEIQFSPRCRTHFGLPSDTAVTSATVWNAVHPEDRPGVLAAVEQALRTRQVYESEYRVTWPDGSVHWLLAFGRGVYGDERETPGMIGVTLDITERKRLETERGELLEREQQASRAKDRFLAVLSHELRTPLSPVVMTLAALQDHPAMPAEFASDLRMVRRNIDLETKLIDDLLDLSRVATGKLGLVSQPVSIHDVLGHVIANCAGDTGGKRVTIKPQLRAAADFVHADPARVQQVFWNLIRNAVKFTPAGGQITVSSCNPEPDCLRVEIRDTGIGIPADVLPKIFDAFEQGDSKVTRQFGGLGLGLAISKALLDLHGGTIRAISDGPGRGATFVVELTALAARPAAPDAPARPPDVPVAPLRLLLVEDHVDTATVLARLLKIRGYTVTLAHDVATALDIAGKQPFDLIISDLGLPDATGFELMTEIKARHGLPGIALSGYGMKDDMRRSRECGFVDHVVKPVDANRLIAVIQRVRAETLVPSAGVE